MMKSHPLSAAIHSLVDSCDRDYTFPLGGGKYILPTPEEREVFDALPQLTDYPETELIRLRSSIDQNAGYTLTIFAIRMALLAFRNRNEEGFSRSAAALLLASAAIDGRDLLRAVSLYADGCRRCETDPLGLLKSQKHLADVSAWKTIEVGFFGREPEMQQTNAFGLDHFDCPHSLLHVNLRTATP